MTQIDGSRIDGSIPASVQAPKFDPLATAGTYTALQSALLNNKLLGGQIAGKQAVGQALAGATDAQGNVDTQAAMAAAARDPNSTFELPAFSKEQQALQTAQTVQKLTESQASKADVEASLAKLEPVYGVVTSMIADPKTPATRENVIAGLQKNLVDTGILTTPHDLDLLNGHIAQLTDSPDQNKRMLANWGISMRPSLDGMALYKGAPQTLNTGPAVVTMRPGGIADSAQVLSSVATGLTPGEKTQPRPFVDSDPNSPTYGQQKQTTVGQMFDAYGNPSTPGAAPAAPGKSGGASPKNGRYPGAPGAGGVLTTSLAPGQSETMQASSKVYQDDLAAVPSLRKTMTTFDQAATALAGAQTGKGSDILQNFTGLANTYGIPINTQATDKYAEASKWLSAAVAQESHNLGLNTDAGRQLQAEAQPGTQTPHGAAVAMLPVLKGLKAMDLAAPIIAHNEGITPQAYSAWKANWANSVDPLAFSANQVPLAQRQAMASKMSPARRTAYLNGVQAAIDAGVFSRSDLK